MLTKAFIFDKRVMVGTDGYAPSTPRMSIEYSTIELSSPDPYS